MDAVFLYIQTDNYKKIFFLENGEKIEEISWYQSGIKREYFKKSPFLHQFWNEKGVLMLEENNNMCKEWYPNGSLKTELFKKKEQVYYRKDGEWVLKIKTKEDFVVLEKNNITFNNLYMEKHYMDLLQDYDFYKYLIIWLDDLDIVEREEVICNMIKSNVLWIKYDGINLASVRYKIDKAIPYIKLEINNHQKPPSVSSGINDVIFGFNSLHFAHTIAERARLALHELEK